MTTPPLETSRATIDADHAALAAAYDDALKAYSANPSAGTAARDAARKAYHASANAYASRIAALKE